MMMMRKQLRQAEMEERWTDTERWEKRQKQKSKVAIVEGWIPADAMG